MTSEVEIEVEVVGGETHTITPAGNTYADVLDAIDLSPHEAAVLVNGRPVPEDAQITVDHVRVLRLIKGGSQDGAASR